MEYKSGGCSEIYSGSQTLRQSEIWPKGFDIWKKFWKYDFFLYKSYLVNVSIFTFNGKSNLKVKIAGQIEFFSNWLIDSIQYSFPEMLTNKRYNSSLESNTDKTNGDTTLSSFWNNLSVAYVIIQQHVFTASRLLEMALTGVVYFPLFIHSDPDQSMFKNIMIFVKKSHGDN